MKSSYALGLFYIFLVAIIWSIASIIVQYVYQELNFDSPFIITYIGTGFLTILIPIHFVNGACFTSIRDQFMLKISSIGVHGMNRDGENRTLSSTRNNDSNKHGLKRQFSSEGTPLSSTTNELNEEDGEEEEKNSSTLHMSTSLELDSQQQYYDYDDMNNEEEAFYNENYDVPHHNRSVLSQREHINMAIKVAPFWFISNYFYNLSLQYTTITSSTVLSNTASVFTFLLALQFGDEIFNKWKLIGVTLAFIGSLITSLHDVGNNNNGDENVDNKPFQSQIWGDIAGLISAMGYGVYTVLIRNLCKDESRLSMNLFLGYIGVLNTIILSPILVWFFMSHYSNNSSNNDNDYSDNDNGGNPQVITWYIFLCLAIKGLFDNVLSDYLWAKGIVLTTATVASVGLGLTIPLALLSDVFIIKRADVWTLQGVLGAVLVLSGFIFVNIGEDDREQDETEDPLVEFSESIDHISLS